MVLSSNEARKEFFLTTDDLKSIPRETMYFGFGRGRATNLFQESDLHAAAIAKYGEEGFAKKVADRFKRAENKRKREEKKAAEALETEQEARCKRQAIIAAVAVTDPKLAKKEEAKERRLAKKEEAKKLKAAMTLKRNQKIAGDAWKLTIVHPESVAGTAATLKINNFPPIGWGDDGEISCFDSSSPAFSFGNIHGFKGKSSEKDEKMVFETKWKVYGKRHTGKLTVSVKPSDKAKEEEKVNDCGNEHEHEPEHNAGKIVGDDQAKAGGTNDKEGGEQEESLMVVGTFNSGVSGGVRIWKFKGYRD